MTAVIISILLWAIVAGRSARNVRAVVGEAACERRDRGARDRADTSDEICAIRAKTRVKARARTLMDVKTNYESGR